MTDHQPFATPFNRANVSSRVLRWSLKLQTYNLEIKYVKGNTNVVADALIRDVVQWSNVESMRGIDDMVVNAKRP